MIDPNTRRSLPQDIIDMIVESAKGRPGRVVSGPIEPIGIPRESAVDLAADNWKARAVLAAMARNKGDETFEEEVTELRKERIPEQTRRGVANVAKGTALAATLPLSGPAGLPRMAAGPIARYMGLHGAAGAAANAAPDVVKDIIEKKPLREIAERAGQNAKLGAGIGLAVPGALLALPEVAQSAKAIINNRSVQNFAREEAGELRLPGGEGAPAPKPPKQPKPSKPAPQEPPKVALEDTPFPAYSRLETAIRHAPFERGTAEQWKAALQKNVAAGERSYTGMDDFLEANAGKVLNREEVLGQFGKGRVKIGSTVRGRSFEPAAAQPETGTLAWEPYEDMSTERGTFMAQASDADPDDLEQYYFYGPDPNRDDPTRPFRASTPFDSEIFASEDEARAWAEAQHARPTVAPRTPPKPTKFQQYQLDEFGEEIRRSSQPGGQSYHEVVLTSENAPYEPTLKPAKVDEAEYRVEMEPHPDGTQMWYVRNPQGQPVAYADTEDEALDWRNRYVELERRRKVPRAGRQDFTQPGHFPEKNPVVHYRANDRVAPNGEKVRFIEEVQSDWNQKIRDFDVAQRRLPQLREQRAALGQGWREGITTQDMAARTKLDREIAETERTISIGRPPQSPFTKTDEWMELALKDIIDKAVKDGVDRVAWTTGAQQNRRWSLSTAVDEIEYNPETGKLVALKGGRAVHTGTYDPRALPEVIGREAAEKMLATPRSATHGTHRLAGEALEVEGHGMRTAYDEILPKAVQSYAKKRGVQVDIEPAQIFQSKEPPRPAIASAQPAPAANIIVPPNSPLNMGEGTRELEIGDLHVLREVLSDNVDEIADDVAPGIVEDVESWRQDIQNIDAAIAWHQAHPGRTATEALRSLGNDDAIYNVLRHGELENPAAAAPAPRQPFMTDPVEHVFLAPGEAGDLAQPRPLSFGDLTRIRDIAGEMGRQANRAGNIDRANAMATTEMAARRALNLANNQNGGDVSDIIRQLPDEERRAFMAFGGWTDEAAVQAAPGAAPRYIIRANSPANIGGEADEEFSWDYIDRADDFTTDMDEEDWQGIDTLRQAIASMKQFQRMGADAHDALANLPANQRRQIMDILELEPAEALEGVGAATATPNMTPVIRPTAPPAPVNQSFRIAPFRESLEKQPLQPLWALLAAAGAGSQARRPREEER